MPGDARLHTYVGEGTVAIVPVELRWRRIVAGGIAIVVDARRLAFLLQLLRVSDKASHEQIGSAIVVEIEPYGGRVKPGRLQSRSPRDIFKGSIAPIPVKHVVAVVGHQQVDKPVAVVIRRGRADPEVTGIGDARPFGDVGKRAIAIIAVQGGAQRFRGLKKIAGAAVRKEQIHPAVVVVIENRDTRSD